MTVGSRGFYFPIAQGLWFFSDQLWYLKSKSQDSIPVGASNETRVGKNCEITQISDMVRDHDLGSDTIDH